MPHSDTSASKSFFGSIKKLGRKTSNLSTKSSNSSSDNMSRSAQVAPEQATPSPSPFVAAHPTRRPQRAGMNAFTVPSNEPPPAYTASPTESSGPSVPVPNASNSQAQQPDGQEDPYTFLSTFDTVLLIDDSGSMAGRSWREVSLALSSIAPIVTAHDSDGITVYFLNHRSSDPGKSGQGVAPTGYRNIRRAETIQKIFESVRPRGGTPTGTRVNHILKSYMKAYEDSLKTSQELKPLNLIVLTDGVPSDEVEGVIVQCAKKLDKLEAPAYQVGIQFFQVGNESGAKEALEELDDYLAEQAEVRDIVDTVTWTGGRSALNGGVGLTGDSILKTVLGSVVKRLDRRPAAGGTASRSRRS